MSTPEVAMAHVVMRVGGLRNVDDVRQLRERIQGELRLWELYVADREQTLEVIDHVAALVSAEGSA